MKELKIVLLLLSLIACQPSEQASEETIQPNIMIIMVDDLGKEWISHYGAEGISTPNIDALAASGLTFNNVYSMPQCTPTRVTLLTGQYPFRHGWVNHWDVPRWGGGAHFDERVNPSIGKEMKKAGYTTCIAGKWQIDDFRVEPDALTKNGFDEYCMWTGYEGGNEPSANRYQDPYIYTEEGSKAYEGAFGPDVFKDFIVNFIHENKKEPMFIYYPMVLTHTPFVNTPIDSASTRLGKHKAMVKYTDRITGELVQALEEEGIRDNTIVIWTTDNGTTGAITGQRNGVKVKGGKAKTIEAGINEPFMISWPSEIKANTTTSALIDFSDIFPTCLDLAGISPQKEWQVGDSTYQIDGVSFKDVLLKDSEVSQREWILGMGGGNNARLTEKGVENQYKFRDRVLRNKQYKLYINSQKEPEKFYDLSEDPYEKNNIIDSLNTEVRQLNFKQLEAVLNDFPKRDNDPKYIPNPAQEWDVEISAKSQEWKL